MSKTYLKYLQRKVTSRNKKLQLDFYWTETSSCSSPVKRSDDGEGGSGRINEKAEIKGLWAKAAGSVRPWLLPLCQILSFHTPLPRRSQRHRVVRKQPLLEFAALESTECELWTVCLTAVGGGLWWMYLSSCLEFLKRDPFFPWILVPIITFMRSCWRKAATLTKRGTKNAAGRK